MKRKLLIENVISSWTENTYTTSLPFFFFSCRKEELDSSILRLLLKLRKQILAPTPNTGERRRLFTIHTYYITKNAYVFLTEAPSLNQRQSLEKKN